MAPPEDFSGGDHKKEQKIVYKGNRMTELGPTVVCEDSFVFF